METARALLRSRRYQYVVFFCHLALEKHLKGLVALAIDGVPPRIHNLTLSADKAGLELPSEQREFFERLNALAMEARYPVRNLQFSRDLAQETFDRANEALQWLAQQKPSKVSS